ncbi:DeoR/GlpR transcriptional regulator [Ornithinibacillus sp. BX22]|uniref:DeoR/GlpR transcriptional regulator n=2 Tax=Ornithinibacillus TaxID=484508 RepID=A0A923RGA1_9BACI|nr:MULTISPECIES: DeoR/GlpR family DNA-binding transcription regulator [Ornithinibacillus]MBC5635513.1 DeoR/GlpR transcriptional regulator [Ornithinibacillus hominis]MBS3679123.1 DeoR/GlpR transcriptional regulator [Ornithinibacillus massiliensis]
MQPSERRQWVLEKIELEGKVEIDSLSNELNVSPMTIRRDLDQLEEEGRVIRVHGGAVAARSLIAETPFLTKEGRHTEEKRQIAKKALSLVRDGQIILLDSGTTTLEIARLLKVKQDLTVITNDIKIAAELVDSKLKVIVTGGELQNDVGALFGPQTHHFLKNIHADLFFLGAHAIDLQAGIMSPTFEKSLVKQLMMEAAESTWLVADSSKIGERALSKVCDLQSLTGFITNEHISEEVKDQLSEIMPII